MLTVRFMTLTGKFTVAKTESFPDITSAVASIVAHATSGGYSRVTAVQEDMDSTRYTARTPGGRNVAFIDIDYGDFSEEK